MPQCACYYQCLVHKRPLSMSQHRTTSPFPNRQTSCPARLLSSSKGLIPSIRVPGMRSLRQASPGNQVSMLSPWRFLLAVPMHTKTQCAYPTCSMPAPTSLCDMIMLYYASHNLRKWTCKSDRQIPSDSISANHLRLVNFAEIIGQSNARQAHYRERTYGVAYMLHFIGYNNAIFSTPALQHANPLESCVARVAE